MEIYCGGCDDFREVSESEVRRMDRGDVSFRCPDCRTFNRTWGVEPPRQFYCSGCDTLKDEAERGRHWKREDALLPRCMSCEVAGAPDASKARE